MSILTIFRQLDDTAMKDITIKMFKDLFRGKTKDEALLNAKLSYKISQKHQKISFLLGSDDQNRGYWGGRAKKI